MSQSRKLHQGHVALLDTLDNGESRTAYPRGFTVQIDGVTQDFLVRWYEELKAWSLISTEDKLGRSGKKIGETIALTPAGEGALAQHRSADPS